MHHAAAASISGCATLCFSVSTTSAQRCVRGGSSVQAAWQSSFKAQASATHSSVDRDASGGNTAAPSAAVRRCASSRGDSLAKAYTLCGTSIDGNTISVLRRLNVSV